jgi:exo-beta-1,3-glucanase (GH17 family)
MMRIAVTLGLMLIAVFGFWFVAGHPHMLNAPASTGSHKLQSVSYAPFEKDQSPFDFLDGIPVISEKRMDEDLAILSKQFDCVRTYSISGLEALPVYAEKYGLKVLLGAWVSSDPKATQLELLKVIEIAKKHPDCVRAIVVGNETLLRREVNGTQLAGYIRQVKSALPNVPVTYADVWEFWLKNPEVSYVTDFVTIHILPYWEDKPVAIRDAMEHVRKIREEVALKIPGKELLIGETGWPSEGRMRSGALPSPINQAEFIRGFIALAENEHWMYNLIEAFDQPWKRTKEGAVGGYWGLYDADRQDKHVISGPVSNYQDWQRWAILTVAVICLALYVTRRSVQKTEGRWLIFDMVMMIGAILIVMQGQQFWMISRNGWEYLWAVVVLFQATAVYLLMLSALADGEVPRYAELGTALEVFRKRQDFSRENLLGILRLSIITCILIAVVGLVMDSRYRSFNNCGFIIPAIAYCWFAVKNRSTINKRAFERICSLLLIGGSVCIFINETPLNIQADFWVILCLILAYPLRKEGKGATLQSLRVAGIIIFIIYVVVAGMKYSFLNSEEMTAQCMKNPVGISCMIRTVIGQLMYNQIFGLTALIFAGVAVWRNSVGIYLLAMIPSLAALNFYNAGMGAVAFVITAISLVHILFRADNPNLLS